MNVLTGLAANALALNGRTYLLGVGLQTRAKISLVQRTVAAYFFSPGRKGLELFRSKGLIER
jgi:hypothetical protein